MCSRDGLAGRCWSYFEQLIAASGVFALGASVDMTCTDVGVEETFAPELVRTDQVAIDEAGAAGNRSRIGDA